MTEVAWRADVPSNGILKIFKKQFSQTKYGCWPDLICRPQLLNLACLLNVFDHRRACCVLDTGHTLAYSKCHTYMTARSGEGKTLNRTWLDGKRPLMEVEGQR